MIFTTSLLSMLLALVVFAFNWKVNRNALFLSILMILIGSSQLRHYLVLHTTEPFWLAILINNPSPLWSMIGACLFFYVRNVLTDQFEFRKSDLLHTIPFWVSLVGILPYLFTPFAHKIEVANLFIQQMAAVKDVDFNWLLDNEVNIKIRYALQIGYALACLWMLAGFKKRRTTDVNRPQAQRGIIHKWMTAVSVYVLLDALYFMIGLTIYSYKPSQARDMPIYYPALYAMGVTITCIPSLVLIFPEILFGIPRLRNTLSPLPPTPALEISEDALPSEAISPTPAASAATTESSELGGKDPFIALGQRVIDYMDREKPYVHQDFSLEDLAEKLGVPRHHLYYCFNKILKKKFVVLRMEYRIKEVKKCLLEADMETTTREAIGGLCGFSSRSAFYRIFTELVGCSPGEFIEMNRPQGGIEQDLQDLKGFSGLALVDGEDALSATPPSSSSAARRMPPPPPAAA